MSKPVIKLKPNLFWLIRHKGYLITLLDNIKCETEGCTCNMYIKAKHPWDQSYKNKKITTTSHCYQK